MSLEISKDLSLPNDAVTQTFAILAQRRKGKTYTANVMAEEVVQAGIPWVVLDPTGAWWGLRSSADGKKAGLPVYVFGGDHGDLPLERTAGKMIADLVVEHPGWYVLDFSHFESKEAERLATWREVLPAGAQRLLDVMVTEVHTNRDELAEISGFTVSGGTFSTYLGMLRRNGIVKVDNNSVELSKGLRVTAK